MLHNTVSAAFLSFVLDRCMRRVPALAGVATAIALAPICAAAQVVEVDGTGSAAIDVPAVQAAVNAGGTVLLRGTFDFSGAESGSPLRVITVQNSVQVAGVTDEEGALPKITGGQRPFFVNAPASDVSFDNLRFDGSLQNAIAVAAAHDVSVTRCVMTGLVPVPFGPTGELVSAGISVMPGPFDAVTIAGNEIDATATAGESSNGVAVIGNVATLVLANNSVRNTTAHGFDLRNIVGTATLTGNRISTGEIGRPGGPGFYVDGIRCAGSGSYTVEHNSVDTGFGNAAAIRLARTLGALVHANRVNMLVPDGTPIGAQSAGIVVQGSASDNVVRNNRIGGHALVALSVIHSDFPLDKGSGSGNPSDTLLLGNEFETFDATFVDIEIGPGAVNTRIVGGSGSIDDQGTGTTATAEYARIDLSLPTTPSASA